jgi:hypothetical protein
LRWARALISIRPDGSRTARNTFDVNNHDGLKKKKEKRKRESPHFVILAETPPLFVAPPTDPTEKYDG